MKKTLFLTTLVSALSSLAALGAGGDFVFATSAGYVWDIFGIPQRAPANMNVSFLWGAGVPLVDSIATFTPTNTFTPGSLGWNEILNDSNFQLAVNDTSSQFVVGTTTGTGGVVYNGANPFSVSGTSPLGGTTTVFMIAWQNVYATPQLAAASGAALVGWSAPFAYPYAQHLVSVPFNFSAQSVFDGVDAHFGLGIPEPSSFSLISLSVSAFAIFRRRSK